MKFEEALAIAEYCRKGKITAGPVYFSPAYSVAQLVDCITTLVDHTTATASATHDELVVANRRYAALNARHQKLVKKHGEVADES